MSWEYIYKNRVEVTDSDNRTSLERYSLKFIIKDGITSFDNSRIFLFLFLSNFLTFLFNTEALPASARLAFTKLLKIILRFFLMVTNGVLSTES